MELLIRKGNLRERTEDERSRSRIMLSVGWSLLSLYVRPFSYLKTLNLSMFIRTSLHVIHRETMMDVRLMRMKVE